MGAPVCDITYRDCGLTSCFVGGSPVEHPVLVIRGALGERILWRRGSLREALDSRTLFTVK